MSEPHRLLLPPPRHATAIFQRRRSATIPMLFDCCLLVPMLIVLTLLRLIQRHRHLPSARTSIGNAAMEFISSTGTCQVPVPVLALPRWSSFPVRALGKCLYQYWHGYLLPKLVNSIVFWKNCDNKKENTSEFEYGYQYRYCAAPWYW